MRRSPKKYLVVLTLALGVAGEAPTPRSHSDIVYNEAKATFDLVLRKTMDDAGERVPSFSSKAVPAWAGSVAALEAFYSRQDKEIGVLTAAYRRSWTYRVPTAVAGREWDSIGEKELIVEIVNAPPGVAWEGVKKNGLIQKRSPVVWPGPN